MADRRSGGGTFRAALGWCAALAALVGWVPVLGPLVAGLAGGRIARRPVIALLAASIPAALWGFGLYALSTRELKLAGQYIVVGPLAYLAPMQAAALLAGALAGSRSGAGRVAGMLLLGVGLAFFVPRARDVSKLVKDVMEASRVKYEPEKNKTCPENLKQLYSALQLYADGWDGQLPPAARWLSAIKANVPQDEWLHCPAVSSGHDGKYGYAMNPALGGQRLERVKDRASTPLLYDSADLKPDAHDGPESMPEPGRHTGRNNVLYADGNVRQRQ